MLSNFIFIVLCWYPYFHLFFSSRIYQPVLIIDFNLWLSLSFIFFICSISAAKESSRRHSVTVPHVFISLYHPSEYHLPKSIHMHPLCFCCSRSYLKYNATIDLLSLEAKGLFCLILLFWLQQKSLPELWTEGRDPPSVLSLIFLQNHAQF